MKWLVIGVFVLGLLLATKDVVMPLLQPTPTASKAGQQIAAVGGDPAYRLAPLTAAQNKILGQALVEDKAGYEAYYAGRFAEAGRNWQDALTLFKRALPSNYPGIAMAMVNLANALIQQGHLAEAERLFREALALYRRVLSPEHVHIALAMVNLATVLTAQGHPAEGEQLIREALVSLRRTLPPDHPDIASAVVHLANAAKDKGHYAEAERLYRDALALRRRALSPDDPEIALATMNVASAASDQGRFAEAEKLYRDALTSLRRALPPDHPSVATATMNLASQLGEQGRYAEAEALFREVLASNRRLLAPDHPDIAMAMLNLATVVSAQERFPEAERLARGALDSLRRTLPPDHPTIATAMMNLASLVANQDRPDEANQLARDALASLLRALPPDHPDIATAMLNLANMVRNQGHAVVEAEQVYREVLAFRRRVLLPGHPKIAKAALSLAGVLAQQHRYAEAEPLFREGLASYVGSLGHTHPDTEDTLQQLVVLFLVQNKALDALEATDGMFAASDRAQRDTARLRALTGRLLSSLSRLRLTGLTTVQRSQTESRLLELVQAATPSLIGRTADHLAARLGAGDAGLADLLRQRQEARDRARELAAQHLFLLQRGQPEAKATKQELEASEQRAAALQERLGQTYPGYRDLEGGGRVSLAELQAVLQPGEVVLLQVAGEDGLGLMAIRKDRVVLGYAPVGRERLAKLVEVVRSGLEHPAEGFQSDAAAELYQAVVAPVAAALDKVTHVLVQPDGALRSLPLEVLVVGKGAGVVTELPRDRKKLSELKWFGLSYAVSVIPSLRFLVSNRQDARPASRGGPLLGIGDPIVSGNPECAKSPLVSTLEKVAVTPGTRLADVTALRRECPLPGTRQELEAISKGWEAPKGSLNRLLLGPEATERQVKEMSRSGDLARFASVVFSTHGYLPQEASEAAAAGKRPRLDSDMRLTRPAVAANPGRMPEPGLLLTPPAQASEEDDGYLSLSEIAALKLGPAVVTLAACNTGGQGEAGAESLSGLAKAFYHAGARTVLVTHWDVQTKAVGEVNRLVHEHASKPGSGWAGALLAARREQAMSRPYPAYWAVFSLIGDGASAPTK